MDLSNRELKEDYSLDISDLKFNVKEGTPYYIRFVFLVENDEVRELKFVNNISIYFKCKIINFKKYNTLNKWVLFL